jgi:uncharacterized membrane protein
MRPSPPERRHGSHAIADQESRWANLVAIAEDDDFMKDLGQKLPEGAAAFFVLVRETTRDKVVPEVSGTVAT